MDYNDYKVYGLSISAFIFSYVNIQAFLQIILLIVSIVYTIYKTEELINNRRSRKNKKDDNNINAR
jgi:cell division protein FtsL